MPQLDFFTFSHQFFFLSIFFSGLYYFNLLVLFPRIRWFEIEKIYFLKFISFDIYYVNRWTLGVITMILNSYRYFLLENWGRMYQLSNHALFKNVGFTKTKVLNIKKLILISGISFLFFLFFLKNILVFNAEKLMFIYFCLVVLVLIKSTKNIFVSILKEDVKKLINALVQLEYWTEAYALRMRKWSVGMKLYMLGKTRYSVVLNLLKTKQMKLKNVTI